MVNQNLGNAKSAKNDEFYTQYADIEKEMNAYLDFNADVFLDKTVLLPCDDPEWSNFTKYFAQNFKKLGLKKLISTSYARGSKAPNVDPQLSLFEQESPQYDEEKSIQNGRIFILDRDNNGDGKTDVNDLVWDYLEGEGDFRSDEVKALRDQSDVVVTNPPFSLFRDFLAWIIEGNKKFVILGNVNAITYRELFPLFRTHQLWLGPTISSGDREFQVPSSYPLTAAGTRIDDHGNRFIRVKGVRWFTCLDHGRRHQPLALMTQADNKKFSKHKEVKGLEFQKYDNYDAIEVPFTDAIPSDYEGVMGVPITFLDKYNPDQFEILGITQSWDDAAGLKTKTYPTQVQVSARGDRTNVGKLNDGCAIPVSSAEGVTHYEVNGSLFIKPYCRVLIKHRSPAK